MNLPGIRDEVYANVEEIIRYRKKESDERIRKHQKAMADENDFLMRDPECNYTVFFSYSLFAKKIVLSLSFRSILSF